MANALVETVMPTSSSWPCLAVFDTDRDDHLVFGLKTWSLMQCGAVTEALGLCRFARWRTGERLSPSF